MHKRTCVTAANPDEHASIPQFDGEAYFRGDTIEDVAKALIRHHHDLRWIDDEGYRVAYFWKNKGPAGIFGAVKKGSGLVGYLTKATFVVEMYAENCRGLANYEFEAAVFHQLCHLEEEEREVNGEDVRTPMLRRHDLEMFRAEVEHYGLWHPDIRSASAVFARQLKLDLTPEVLRAHDEAHFDAPADSGSQTNSVTVEGKRGKVTLRAPAPATGAAPA